MAIIAVDTIITTAKFTNKLEYKSPYCAGKVANTAAAKPRVRIEVIIGRSLISGLFSVVIHTAAYLTVKSMIESATPYNKTLKPEIEKIMPKKTKKNVLIRKAISDPKRFRP